MSSNDPAARLRALSEFATPWAVWIAATLRLADHVEAGATRVEELADRAGADPDALARLLRLLVALGVFAEPEPGTIANTDVSRLLLDELGWRPWLDLDGAPGIWAESWPRLLEAVRTGSPGRDERWYYEELAARGRASSFDALMAAQVRSAAEQLAGAWEWDSIEHVVDVGGGTGTLLRELLHTHAHLRGTLFDLPQVVGSVDPAERMDVVAGNFFTDPLPRGDAYVLSQILHGWPDRGGTEILRHCTGAGGKDARILVVEGVVPEQPPPDVAAFDLFMLTLSGGRQRTLADFERLAASAGLALRDVRELGGGRSLLVLAQ